MYKQNPPMVTLIAGNKLQKPTEESHSQIFLI